jgi:plastocyanin
MMKHYSVRAALLVVVAIGALALVPRVAGGVLNGAGESPAREIVREIHLVAKDMTFYVADENAPNPTLYARPGERVRIVFSNTDLGMSHDFVIRSWRVNTRLLKGKGQDTIEFTVPNTRGSHLYSCSPHAEMMGGTIVVH